MGVGPAVAGHAYAKPLQEYGVDPQSPRKGGSMDATGSGDELLNFLVQTYLATIRYSMSMIKNVYLQRLKY